MYDTVYFHVTYIYIIVKVKLTVGTVSSSGLTHRSSKTTAACITAVRCSMLFNNKTCTLVQVSLSGAAAHPVSTVQD